MQALYGWENSQEVGKWEKCDWQQQKMERERGRGSSDSSATVYSPYTNVSEPALDKTSANHIKPSRCSVLADIAYLLIFSNGSELLTFTHQYHSDRLWISMDSHICTNDLKNLHDTLLRWYNSCYCSTSALQYTDVCDYHSCTHQLCSTSSIFVGK